MSDLFGRQSQVLAGGLSSDAMFMSWPALANVAGAGLGMMVQQLSVDYRQPIRRVYEIGPGIVPGMPNAAVCDIPGAPLLPGVCAARQQPTYYIIGRPEGRLQFGRFVGPQVLGTCFYRAYGSACGSNVITLSGRAGCNASNAANNPLMTWTMNGVVLDQTSMRVGGQEMVIEEDIGAMFAGLDIRVNGADVICDAQLNGF